MHGKPTAEVVAAWVSLLRTERALLDKVEERLKRAGLPSPDCYHVLHEVDRAARGRLRQSQVQDRTQLAQYTLCRLLDRLQRDGLVERQQCQQDGRNNVLLITAKGRALRRSMWSVYAAAIEAHVGSRLTRAEAEQLATLLAKLVDARAFPRRRARAPGP
jgi:DNA-binding MarR family transcriptional regulator